MLGSIDLNLSPEGKSAKVNEKMNANTFRLRHYYTPITNPTLSIKRKCDYNHEENTKTFGMTEIDELFNLTELAKKSKWRRYGDDEIKLNNETLWNDLIDELGQYPHYTKRYTCGTDVFNNTIFKVPIKEYKTVVYDSNLHKKESGWIDYNGKSYDPNKIYTIETQHSADEDGENYDETKVITELCDQQLPNPFPHQSVKLLGLCDTTYAPVWRKGINVIDKTHSSPLGYSYATTCINPGYIWMSKACSYYTSLYTHTYLDNNYLNSVNEHNVSGKEIIFDTKQTKCLTHLGILAPQIRVQNTYLNDKKNKKACFVEAANLGQQSWVTSFRVWYKNNATDNWTYMNEYKGNYNCYKMNLIDLTSEFNSSRGLYCRYLKVVVKSFHRNPSFRLALYGRNPEKTQEKTCENINAQTNNDEKKERKKDEIIEYHVEFPVNNTKKVPDGRFYRWDYCYYGKSHLIRTNKKMAFLRSWKNGSFDDFDDFDDGYDYEGDADYYYNSYSNQEIEDDNNNYDSESEENSDKETYENEYEIITRNENNEQNENKSSVMAVFMDTAKKVLNFL
jgi:hypothetical protein